MNKKGYTIPALTKKLEKFERKIRKTSSTSETQHKQNYEVKWIETVRNYIM